MTELRDNNIQFRKLFDVKILPEKQTFIGLSDSGELLFITEKLAGMVMLSCERHIFRLDKDEFRTHLERARRRGKLQKAIANGYTTEEELELIMHN